MGMPYKKSSFALADSAETRGSRNMTGDDMDDTEMDENEDEEDEDEKDEFGSDDDADEEAVGVGGDDWDTEEN